MLERSPDQTMLVGGGSAVALLGLAVVVIANAGAIHAVASGVFDGFDHLRPRANRGRRCSRLARTAQNRPPARPVRPVTPRLPNACCPPH